jgi:K+ transporter
MLISKVEMTLSKVDLELAHHYVLSLGRPENREAFAASFWHNDFYRHVNWWNMMETTFFLSRDNIVPTLMPGMALWRERLFMLLSRNATPAHEFFRIPTNRVVELGTLLEI